MNKRGFSLVEAVVMMAILGVTLTGLLALVSQSCRGDRRHARLAPLELAMRNELDRLAHLPYPVLATQSAEAGPAWRTRVRLAGPGLLQIEVAAQPEPGEPLVIARLVARRGAFQQGEE